MRIALRAVQNLLRTDVACPYVRVREEEPLCRREAVAGLQTLTLGLALFVEAESQVTNLQTAVVSNVLTQRERTVSVYARSHFDLVERFFHHFRALVEGGFVLCRPPVDHVTVLVELTTLIVEAVGHLMTDDNTDSAVVERVIGIHIEERILQDAGRETDLVGRGVIVCVHRLRGHVPFLLVHRLAEVAQAVLLLEFSSALEVRVVGILRVDVEFGIVAPLVGITDLDGDGVQLLEGFDLRLVGHPC